MTDRAHMPEPIPNLLCYEELVAARTTASNGRNFDEYTAASLCYTSGTTGNPKGVLYAHRSTILHAYAAALPDALNLSARDVMLPVVPMFHANAWSLPYACAMVGAKLVFPGPRLDGKSLYELFEAERVTLSAGVPTVWLALLQYMAANKLKFSHPEPHGDRRLGRPPAMISAFQEEYGVHGAARLGHDRNEPARHRVHAQGQARDAVEGREARHPGQAGPQHLRRGHEDRRRRRQGAALGRQGVRRPAGARAVDHQQLLQGRGRRSAAATGGWFPTGDVATIDPDGYMQITDRSKDVIKSGGEWISSIDLENIAVAIRRWRRRR